MGIPLIKAKAEGEAQCAWLVKNKFADIVLSDDWDILLYDVEEVYRNLSFKKEFICQYVNIQQNLQNLCISKSELITAIILSGTDYHEGVNKVGPIRALELVKKHKTLENMLKNQPKYDFSDIIDTHAAIKKYLDDIDVMKVQFVSFNQPKLKELEEYLANICNFSHQYIYENLKLLL